MRKHIPNILTIINLLCGCLAIYCLFFDHIEWALILFAGSNIADFLDGMSARMLKSNSPIGRELDSLADVISFGVSPSTVLFIILAKHFTIDLQYPDINILKAVPAYLFAAFAAIRLAKFNIDTAQTDHFKGLPVPSASIFVFGILCIYHFNALNLTHEASKPFFIYVTICALCTLMVSRIPLFGLKFKHFGWKGNQAQYVFLILCVLAAVLFKEASLSLIVLVYIVLSLLMKKYFLVKK